MSADAATAATTAESAGPSRDWDSLAKRAMQPVQALLLVYFVYFAVTYSRIWTYVPGELLSLSTYIMGFVPSTRTFALYLYGALVLVFGVLLGVLIVRSLHGRAPLARLVEWFAGRAGFLRHAQAWFWIGLAGWAIGAAATGGQWVASRGISLTDIGSRWFQSPIVVWIAMTQIFFLPVLVVTARRPWQRWLTAALFLVSIVGLATLGARNIPAKAVVSTFFAVVYVAKPKQLVRLAAALAVVMVVAMGVVGAYSKAGIYNTTASAKLVVALTYSDSVGTVYNLDRIVRLTPTTGLYHGTLLRDSVLAAVPHVLYPGIKPVYANFQLGRYLGGRQFFVINKVKINQGVSLAPTLLGAAYADGGVPGVVLQMLLLGLLLGYLQYRARSELWLVPGLVAFASYVVNGVNVGVHSPNSLAAIAMAAVVMIVDLLAGRRDVSPEGVRSVAA